MPTSNPSMFSRRKMLATFGAVTAGVTLAACGGGSDSDSSTKGSGNLTPKRGGTLKIAMPAVSDYINPLVATTSSVAWVTAPVVETLYTYDDDMRSVPLLAAGQPKISSDGLTWTIKIAKGIKFSNGDPLTAEHVAAVINHVANPEAFTDWTSYFGYSVTGATAKDDATLEIKVPAPYGILLSHLTNLPIVHKDFLDKTDTTVGTGPFVVGKVTQGQSVVLTRNNGYHGKAAAPDRIEFTSVPDAATRLVSLRAGTIHVMTDVPPSNVSLLGKDKNITVHVEDAPISILTYFNATKAPFDDVRVRQAIAHSMDRAGVQELVYNGTATIAQGPAGPALEGYNDAVKLYSETPDIEKAKALLAEAGVDSVDFSLTISSSSDDTVKMAQVLVAGWKKAGINCTLDTTDGGTWVQRWMEGDYEMAMTTYVTGISAGKTAFPLYTSYGSANTMNFGYSNAKVDALMGQAWATVDPDERASLCQEADALLAEDAIAVPPVYPKIIVAQRNDVSVLSQSLLSVGRVDAAGTQLLA